jgi:gamma-glutamylcyclotransferase (GGCT)/AIG2-like uncharacterized protein YtfP
VRAAKPPSRAPAAVPKGRTPIDLLFVYGTLMRGMPLHHVLAGMAHVGDGRIAARLVDLGAYPGAVPASDAEVRGEVYRIARAERWAALDYAEGPQYDRREVAVRLDDGGRVIAFVYWYRGPLDAGVPIPGGDYRAHAPARSIHYTPRNPGGP